MVDNFYMLNMIENKILKEIKELKANYFPSSFPKIFSWEELEKLLNLRPFVNVNRLKITDDAGYSWNRQAWLSDLNTFPPSLLNEILKKHICHFADASRANEKINGICSEIEEAFPGYAADAHIYFTVADNLSAGFGAHWDYAHNLIVQVEGTTKFEIWDIMANPDCDERTSSSIQQEPSIQVTLNPGDAVFVPMYQYHKATSLTKRLSVSFPFNFSLGEENQDRYWIKLF
jgi:hypothetical protein